tara:strand:- start:15 stop:362 length:348 start_codon:yes stop_codon:yes gene_type:complete
MKFNDYLVELRRRKYSNSAKLAKILGIDHRVWRKVERGINPPPKRSLLNHFCLIVNAKEYEKNQLYALAKKWEPHQDSNTSKHNLWNERMGRDWAEAILKENTPDYPNKYWSKSK